MNFRTFRRLAVSAIISLSAASSAYADIAVLDMGARSTSESETSGDYARQLYSATYLCDVAGYPYYVTKDLSEAMKADVMLFASVIYNSSFSADEWQSIADWISGGGVLVSPAVRNFNKTSGPFVEQIFGLDSSQAIEKFTDRKIIVWNQDFAADKELEYFDEPEERETSIGAVKSFGFKTGDCDVLASFENGKPAVVRKCQGDGAAYLVPVSWRDVVQRNQLNKDQSASRHYNNAFEPSSDIWAFFLRSIHAKKAGVSAWKFTSPGGYLQVLVPTHDCDSRTAYQEMHWMGDYEKSLGLRGHYFLTTHYYSDKKNFGHEYLSDFYDAAGIANAKQLHEDGHTMGSHSVCHFPDFSSVKNCDVVTRDEYSKRATCENGKSTGASTWAEIVMSKNIIEGDFGNDVRSFRSGHLCVNSDFHPMLEEGGYEFQSCYTAGDLLSEFPFFGRMDNNWETDLSSVLTIPLHISDVYNENSGLPLNNDTWETHPAPDQWAEAMRKLKGNYASAVLLIHPNREWKMILEKRLVERLDLDDTGFYNFEDYGDFWKARLNAEFRVEYDDQKKKVTVFTDLDEVDKNRLTFAIECVGSEVVSAEFRDANSGRKLDARLRKLSDGRMLAVPASFGGVDEVKASPLPAGLYDLYGRRVQKSGAKGIYILSDADGIRKVLL